MRRKYTGEPMSSEPRSVALSMKRLPARSCVTAGGNSRPTNSNLEARSVPPSLSGGASTPI
ncbi:Uncharacterised protein [Bordetella pertussis]|nr:Uncharacterised protein [Bordetella pertussis]